ncbi:hypothetical protein N431DRAFT_478511, partial [Stipitochalara longipes BDJ]
MDSTKYSSLDHPSKIDDDDFDDFVPPSRFSYRLTTIPNRRLTPVLIAICVLLASLSSALAWMLHNAGTQCIDKGLATELEPAKSTIEMVQKRFTGALKFDQIGNVYREVDLAEPQYVGEASPHIDNAWNTLLDGLYIGLEGDEAKSMVGKTGIEDGKYLTSTDMLHTLHCVNEVRKAIDSDYYKVEGNPVIHRMHLDHCLDYIRQSVQCFGDLTPMTFNWNSARKDLVADFDSLH